MSQRYAALISVTAVAGLAVIGFSGGCTHKAQNRLVVYCSHDALYSQQVLDRFEAETGIHVDVKFDTEANKSVGFVALIRSERDQPRCDVFWNNQVLGTVALAEEGLFHAYKGPGFERIPGRYRDPDGHWAGFAARLRVYIVNTDLMTASTEAIDERLAADPTDFVLAKPMFGTTLTHFSVLHDVWGPDQLRQWYEDLSRRGAQVVAGNSTTKNLVAEGKSAFGWTDTDDYFLAVDAGKPVSFVPVEIEADGNRRRTIAIPNSVAIVKGSSNLPAAKRLVDFLLSEQVELELSRSRARQVPLGSVDETQLSAEVLELMPLVKRGIALSGLAENREAVLSWLSSE
ncbi:extracellular solute-binding protein [Stratiformator vulcanicus]|uniref:Iron deficiency-induced protein A n=1 Tax=Stratiformator vulcanicus TaxID=2527980 RepID=A0A517R0B8_9PLAN|nr:extracellular solute-binding protein [Stratiformator vulcanicus]QDT37347.1 Iron deficiency-induced protein A precursor [Stratiformator vulcanicus]